jgi:hypothetical protein
MNCSLLLFTWRYGEKPGNAAARTVSWWDSTWMTSKMKLNQNYLINFLGDPNFEFYLWNTGILFAFQHDCIKSKQRRPLETNRGWLQITMGILMRVRLRHTQHIRKHIWRRWYIALKLLYIEWVRNAVSNLIPVAAVIIRRWFSLSNEVTSQNGEMSKQMCPVYHAMLTLNTEWQICAHRVNVKTLRFAHKIYLLGFAILIIISKYFCKERIAPPKLVFSLRYRTYY